MVVRFWGFGLEKRSLNLVVAVWFSGGWKRQLKITEERERNREPEREGRVEKNGFNFVLAVYGMMETCLTLGKCDVHCALNY